MTNPLADPLTPFWREKVESAFSGRPTRSEWRLTSAQAETLFYLALGFTPPEVARHFMVHRDRIYYWRDTAIGKIRRAARS